MEFTHTLLYFSAEWCRPCKVMSKSVAEVVKDHPEWLVSKVDVEEQADFADGYNIKSLPTVILIDSEGTEVARIMGASSPADLRTELGV